MHLFTFPMASSLTSWMLATTVVSVLGQPADFGPGYYHTNHANGLKSVRATELNSTNNSSARVTADSTTLQTWWHETGEINTKTPVKDGNVRQSHLYSVQVASAGSDEFHDSFVYETIPRNGNGNICTPGDLSSVCNVDDQISIEPAIGVTMAWTQFLHGSDAVVKITRSDGKSVAADNVVIRPTNLDFEKHTTGNALYITVPHNVNGHRFSVEFHDDLWTYRNAGPGENSHYVQNVNPADSGSYVQQYTDDMPIVGVEPLNALLIFASPFPSRDMVPDNEGDTYHVTPGLVNDLGQTTKSIVHFGPGVYWMTGKAHAKLSSSVTWVYFAPGSYVKGAIEYSSQSLDLRATGFGVLSGEQYVYQANTQKGYINEKDDTNSLKMWRGESADGMTWTLHGVTMNAPPFNSMDFYGHPDKFSVQVSDYKQVGAFFGQTDGTEIYPGSHIHDVFYHVGDDGIKTYYSNVLAERVIVWKTNNAPIVQFGWYPRDLENITVDSVDVIHTRYISQAGPYPRALVASAASYTDINSHSTADTSKHISQYKISNWRAEGISPALLGINPLENIDNMIFSNIWIEELAPHTTMLDTSTFTVWTDPNGNPIHLGDNSPNNKGLSIRNFYVGNVHVTQAANNWDSYSLGRLNIDGAYWGRWEAI